MILGAPSRLMTQKLQYWYGIYEVEDITKPDGSWNGVRCSVIDAKGEYGFIANTDIPIKPDTRL